MAAENPTPSEPLDPWNKGRLIGQKRPLKPKDVWTVRVRLQLEGRKRDLAMFNLAIETSSTIRRIHPAGTALLARSGCPTLTGCGSTDPNKPFYSHRHTATSYLRNTRLPDGSPAVKEDLRAIVVSPFGWP